jgi:hypothetical protein
MAVANIDSLGSRAGFRTSSLLLLVIALVFSVSGVVQAQNIGRSTGELRGVVMDETGGVLPGATVTITSPALIGQRVLVTDSQGSYGAPGLPKGVYRVQVEMSGFVTSAAEDVELKIGDILKINFDLKAGFSETIDVTAKAVIDVVSVEPAYDLSAEAIVELPKGRSWESLVEITPTVTEVRVGEGRNQKGLSFQGASVSENVYIIDGVDTTSTVVATTGQDIIFEFVDTIQVKSGFLGAEYGGALGGLVQVQTKSGSNDFNGLFNFEYRSSDLIGDPRPRLRVDPFDSTRAEYVQDPEDPFREVNVGGVLGGPILRDRLWFFGGYVPQFTDRDRDVTFISTGETRNFQNDLRRHFFMGKLSLRASDSLMLSAGYSYSPYKDLGELPSLDGTGDPEGDYGILGEEENKSSYAFNFQWTASPKVFVEGFAGVYQRRANSLGVPDTDYVVFDTSNYHMSIPSQHQGPAGFTSGPYNLGTAKDDQDRLNLGLNATFSFNAGGEHNLKLGAQHAVPKSDLEYGFLGDRISVVWDRPFFGQRGAYGHYKIYDIGTSGEVESNNTALFFQDSWSPVDRWTFNIGLRFEREKLTPLTLEGAEAEPIEFGFGDKIAPRLGVAWDVRGDGTWKIYANGGVFYDTLKHALPRDGFGGGRFNISYRTLDTYDWESLSMANPTGRLIYRLDFRSGIPLIDPDLKQTNTREYAIGSEYQIGRDLAFGVQYLHRSLHNVIEDFQGADPSDPNAGRMIIGNAGEGLVAQIPAPAPWPKFTREYDGLEVTLRKRMSDNWTGTLAYTFSRLYGNYDGLADPAERTLTVGSNPNQGRYCTHIEGCYTSQGTVDEGRLTRDTPHELKVNGSYSFPFGLTVGGFFLAKSGVPVSRAMGVNAAPYTYPEGRLTDGRTDAVTQLDLYLQWGINLSEGVRASLTANILNVFDQDAATHIWNHMLLGASSAILVPQDVYFAGYDYQAAIDDSGTARDPQFLQADFFQRPREIRLGVRLDF